MLERWEGAVDRSRIRFRLSDIVDVHEWFSLDCRWLRYCGLLAAIASGFWGTDRTTDTRDFGPVVVGLILVALSEVIAITLAVIGFMVEAV